MDLICPLPASPIAIIEQDEHRLVLAFADGLAVLEDTSLDIVVQEKITSAARGPDGCIYYTQDGKIFRCYLERDNTSQDITATFAGSPQGQQRIVCTPEGDIWVEGCSTRQCTDGTFSANPAYPTVTAPAPHTLDTYGNFWSLVDGQVLVLPANAPDVWQVAWLAAGSWEYLVADSVGFTWIAGPDGWQLFCPRQLEKGWQDFTMSFALLGNPVTTDSGTSLERSAVTAIGTSPDDLGMAAFANGELLELNTEDGALAVRSLAHLPEPARCMHTDRDGAIWAASDKGLYRREVAADAWQKNWQKKRGRLPGGGNHDIFSVECQDKLYIAGGWAGAWGLPPIRHVLDELFAYDPESEYWSVVSHMIQPRRYNGIAEMDGCVWIIGGETRVPGWHGEGQVVYTVEIYDPASKTWSPGPSLNIARTDPFVVCCNGRIYAIGGAAHNSGPKLDSVESIGPGEETWRLETPLIEPTRQGHGCALDGIIYCASIDGVFAFDTANGQWDDDLPQPSGPIGQGPLAAAYRGEVWLIGGPADKGIRCYNPQTRAWRTGPDMPTPQAWGAAIVVNEQLIITGGAHESAMHGAVVYDDRTYVLRDGANDDSAISPSGA